MGNIRGGTLGFHGTIGQPTAQVIDGSLKFQNDNSTYLTRTPSSAGNRSVYTGSVWVKRTKFAPENNSNSNTFNYTIFSAGTNSANNIDNIKFYKNAGTDDANKIEYSSYTGSYQYLIYTNAKYRDPDGWYNVVWNYDGTTAKLYVNGEQITSFDTNTQNGGSSGHFNNNVEHVIGHTCDQNNSSQFDGYMSQFYWIDGQPLGPEYFGFTDPLTNTWRPRKVKTTGPNNGTTWSSVSTISSGSAASGKPLTNGFNGSTSDAFEGDTSGATVTVPVSANIIKGGVRVYAAVTSSQPLVVVIKNGDTTVETINAGSSGGKYYGSSSYSGPITSLVISRTGRAPEFNAISINGIILKDNSTTNFEFGTNGFYLPMDNQDDFEKDKSGNGNDFTKNNFSGTSIDPDIVKDSPSGAVSGGRAQTGITTTSSAPANYAVFNALDNHGNTLSSANLTASNTAVNWHSTFGSIPSSDGRHYFEVTPTTITTTCAIGVYVGNGRTDFNGNYPYDANTYMIHQNGYIYHAASTASYQTTYSANDTVGVAVDSKNRKVWISVNGSYVSGENPTTGVGGLQSVNGVGAMPDGEIYPVVTMRSAVANINFGQKPFKYAPPQGYLPLNSASARSNKVVPRPDQYVGVTTYVGNGGTQSINSLNMDPNLVWIKNRDESVSHFLYDSVRGANKYLRPDGNFTEDTGSSNELSFIHKGFTVNGAGGGVNKNTIDFVAWTWKAGGNKNTFNIDDVGYATASAAGLTGGDITPTGASVGTKQGFSIIKYTGSGTSGDTLPHGLSQTPDLIITKCLDASSIDWIVKPVGLLSSESHMLILNDLNAEFQGTGGHISAQTSTTVTLTEGSNDGNYNNSGDNYIMYSWHNVPGLQKFGKYTGNNSSDGPYVDLGFRPAIVWIKGLDFAANWFGFDNQRTGFNPTQHYLYLDRTNGGGTYDAASTAVPIDFLSNGFKVRFGTAGYINNTSSYNFVYCAWAEAPASNLFGGQSNAR